MKHLYNSAGELIDKYPDSIRPSVCAVIINVSLFFSNNNQTHQHIKFRPILLLNHFHSLKAISLL